MGWWSRLRAAVVEWLDFQPRAPYYTRAQLEDIRLREEALARANARPVDAEYELSRVERLIDDEYGWPKDITMPIVEDKEVIFFGGSRVGKTHPHVSKGDPRGVFFDLFPDDPKKAARLQAAADRKAKQALKRPRKAAKAKVPKTGTNPPQKGRKPTKARTERNKSIPTKGGRKK